MKTRFVVEIEWEDYLDYFGAKSTLRNAANCINNVYSASVKELPYENHNKGE